MLVDLGGRDLVFGDGAALDDGAVALAVAADLMAHGHTGSEELRPGHTADPGGVDGHAALCDEHGVLQVAGRPVLLPARVLAEVEEGVEHVVAKGVKAAGDGRAHGYGVAAVADSSVLRHHHLHKSERLI